jgi:hypothetical protein
MFIIIIFLIFLTLFGILLAYTNDIKDSIKENFENDIEIELDEENCEKRIWDDINEKGWRCIAPPPKDKLEYVSNINVKYHDTIDDIKSQNPNMDLDLTETIFRDNDGNTFTKYTSLQQNNNKYSGDGKYKYGYDNYVPTYEQTAILSKIRENNQNEIDLMQEKLKENNDDSNSHFYDYYNLNKFDMNEFNKS